MDKKKCIEEVSMLAREPSFKIRGRKREPDFSRERKMTVTELIYFMLDLVQCSTQNALERFFPQLREENLHMSQQAFSAARQKIPREAFEELFQVSVRGSYNEEVKWRHGYRIMAVDGSCIRLPSDKELLAYFGGLGPERTAATALGSLRYDLENDIILDAQIAPISTNERSLAERHLEALTKLESFNRGHKELIIFDRGSPSRKLITSLQEQEIAVIMRVQKGCIPPLEPAEEREGRVRIGKGGPEVRALQLTLDSGEVETLITSIGEEELPYEAFAELYRMRWGIETNYQTVKQKLELENFSGLRVDNIQQDFYAMMTVANMLSSAVREADTEAKRERAGKGNRYEYQVNVNHAVGVFKDRLIRVLLEDDPIARDYLMRERIHEIPRRVVPVRPWREVPSKDYSPSARFHRNHKSNC